MSKDLNKRLYAFSMFDGYLGHFGNSINASLVVNMLEKHSDYIDRVIQVLEDIPLGYNKSLPEIYAKDGCNRSQQIRLQSKSHPILTKIRERIYIEGRKVVDPHMLTMMDAEMLAIAFMADGSRYMDLRWANSKPSYRLHLNNLSYGDLMLIKKSLKETFGLEINTRKKGMRYDLAVPNSFSEMFEDIVSDFVLPSFQYKLGRQAPEMGDDIVCSAGRLAEIGRNDQSTSIDVVTIKVPNSH